MEALEGHDLVERRIDGRRRWVDVAHPLHGEVVRARLPRTRLEAIQRRLADRVQAHGGRRRDDVMRIAAWRVDSGEAKDPELLTLAARQALAALDWALAERLARAAVRVGGGFSARLTLGRALAGAGRAQEAQHVLGELEDQASDDPERAAVAVAIARNLFWAMDRADDADAALRRAERAVSDVGVHDELVALRVRLMGAAGRPLEVLELAEPLLRDANVRERSRLQAAIATAEAMFSCGRINEALAVADAWTPIAANHREEQPLAEPTLLAMRAYALRHAGRLIEGTAVAEQIYELELARRSAQNTALAATELGMQWLARGRVRTALRFFREGAALLRDADAVDMLSAALAGIGQAAAQAGDPEAARAAVEEMDGKPIGHKGFEPEFGLARAWSAAADGELSRACALAQVAAGQARSRGQHALVVRALHELCRLGDPAGAAPELARLADRVDGEIAPIASAHAAALAASDGPALLEVAERFAARDALLMAAEAAQAGASAHREAGRAASARTAAARAAIWFGECEGARTPWLLDVPAAEELTRREREIAHLAASGLSSRDIADRLVVSVRTVDNHLQRVYRKLA